MENCLHLLIIRLPVNHLAVCEFLIKQYGASIDSLGFFPMLHLPLDIHLGAD